MVPEVVAACRLQPAQRSALVSVLAEAVEHDPMQAWLFPNLKRRMLRRSRFYERDIAVRLEERSAACMFDTRAVAYWLPADQQGRGLGRALLEWGLARADREGVGTDLVSGGDLR